MTYEEAVAYIENYDWSRSRLGLERTRALLAALDEPQKGLKFVHVAGSNGKGSTCAMLEAVLRAAGYKTGLYTSPYIEDFCERIRVDGEMIPHADLAAVTERVAAIADAMDDHPSQFELVTAAAMAYFRERECDIVVLEVGMGGALDSTNAIDAPEAAVITNIGLEHTEYLGDAIEKIAAAKAGVIKPGCACVLYDGDPAAAAVVRAVCETMGVPLRRADNTQLKRLSSDLDGQRFTYRGRKYDLALLGAHQLKNAAVVLETVAALRARGWHIGEAAVRAGLRRVKWPARLEILARQPLFLLDGGHNPQCAEALAAFLREGWPDWRPVFLMGMLADKDYRRVCELIKPLAHRVFCLTPPGERALPAQALAETLADMGARAEACETVAEGVERAMTAAHGYGVVVCFGSLYLAGQVRGAFRDVYRPWLRKTKLAAREAYPETVRYMDSEAIAARIMRSPEYKRARTVMLYRAVGSEVSLALIEDIREADIEDGKTPKRLVYPRCLPGRELEAREPEAEDAFLPGPFGIGEPDPARSRVVPPEQIDLVICPCAAFSPEGGRMGMGAGYYDRFLPKCKNAFIAAAALDIQYAESMPVEPWDFPMDAVFTAHEEYRPKKERRQHGEYR